MSASLAAAVALALAAGQAPAPDLSLARPPQAMGAGHGGDADCGACHTAAGWDRVAFAHERTGFALEGRHREVACRACHAEGDFAKPLPPACSACHRDVHAGRAGLRCGRCHEATSWREVTFDADAHRRSAFPLTGRHAVISCEECHGDRRERAFSRPTPACVSCHETDQLRGDAAMPGHSDFGGECRDCHGTWRFAPASLPAHEACFALRSGPHSGIRCRDCHAPVPPVPAGSLTCTSGTADCRRCHACPDMDARHQNEPGYQCAPIKCYTCHQFAGGG